MRNRESEMGIETIKGNFYRMPVFFGPTPGPRQWPDGRDFDFTKTPVSRVACVRFLSDRAMLEALLPPGFSVWKEPVVTVEITYMTEIGWLAGRGYNMCDVKFDVVFQGTDGPVHGTLVLVRWENLCDPILSGREELGHNKLFCEIPALRVLDGRHSATMSWLETPFLDVAISDLQAGPDKLGGDPLHRGMLSYKYIPATGDWGDADVEYATLSAPMKDNVIIRSFQVGAGEVEFRRSTWDQLPTLHHIVNAFADLPKIEMRGGYLVDATGGSSVSQTIRLR
jgi:Acetoacetate decarboxylase (ADC)